MKLGVDKNPQGDNEGFRTETWGVPQSLRMGEENRDRKYSISEASGRRWAQKTSDLLTISIVFVSRTLYKRLYNN